MTLPSLDWPSDENALRAIIFGPGYGESIVLGTRSSGWIVIDSLTADAGGRTVNPALEVLGDTAWSLLMLTHPHEDHSLGMAELADQPQPGHLACVRQDTVPSGWDQAADTGEDPAATPRIGSKEEALKAINTLWDLLPDEKRWDPRAGDSLTLGDIELLCLWPTPEAVSGFEDGDDHNTISTALIARWGEQRLLLGADVLTAQWREITKSVGEDVLVAHGLMKIPHHGSEGAIIEALDGCPDGRTWVMTPYDCGRGLPRFEDKNGVDLLHAQQRELCLSALPFRWPGSPQEPFRLTRANAVAARNDARSARTGAVRRRLPRPVNDAWIDVLITARQIGVTLGPVAGVIVADP